MTPRPKASIPLPRIDEESRGFWEACARHELVVQRCAACRVLRYYPRALCPRCLSDDVEWVRCSGRGTVYSFTVMHQNQAPGFRERLPYVLAYIELEEGPRMLTTIVECDAVRIGMPVEVTFEDVSEHVALPRFRPAGTSASHA